MNTGIWGMFHFVFLNTYKSGSRAGSSAGKKLWCPFFTRYVISSRQLGHDHTCGEGLIFIAAQGKIYSSIVHIISRCHFLSIHSQDEDHVWICWESGWEDKCLGCA